MNSPAPATSARVPLSEQRYRDCGEGTLAHPVTGSPIMTRVVELEGFGRIFEVMDYSGSEGTMALVLKGPEMLKVIREASEVLGAFTRDGRVFDPPLDDPARAKVAPLLARLLGFVGDLDSR